MSRHLDEVEWDSSPAPCAASLGSTPFMATMQLTTSSMAPSRSADTILARSRKYNNVTFRCAVPFPFHFDTVHADVSPSQGDADLEGQLANPTPCRSCREPPSQFFFGRNRSRSTILKRSSTHQSLWHDLSFHSRCMRQFSRLRRHSFRRHSHAHRFSAIALAQ